MCFAMRCCGLKWTDFFFCASSFLLTLTSLSFNSCYWLRKPFDRFARCEFIIYSRNQTAIKIFVHFILSCRIQGLCVCVCASFCIYFIGFLFIALHPGLNNGQWMQNHKKIKQQIFYLDPFLFSLGVLLERINSRWKNRQRKDGKKTRTYQI